MSRRISENGEGTKNAPTIKPYVADRVGPLSGSVWNEIGSLAQQYECISLTGGIPDYATPQKLKDAGYRRRQDVAQFSIHTVS